MRAEVMRARGYLLAVVRCAGHTVRVLVTRTRHTQEEAVRGLVAAVERRGLTVFAHIDHAGAAREAGLELRDLEVVLFGNPQAGTGLMQSDPRVGIELPLRVVVWDAGDGIHLGWNDPRELASRYAVEAEAETLETMATLLADLVAEAAA